MSQARSVLNHRYSVESAEIRAYWLALGRFLHRFAEMEQQIYALLIHEAGLSTEVGQALFSGTRADLALSHISRLREARREPESELFNRARQQFGVINGIRNDIVHLGATLVDDTLQVSNEKRVLPRQGRKTAVSPETLIALANDLFIMSGCLSMDRYYRSPQYNPNERQTGPNPTRDVARLQWQYQPQQDNIPRTAKAKSSKRVAPPPP